RRSVHEVDAEPFAVVAFRSNASIGEAVCFDHPATFVSSETLDRNRRPLDLVARWHSLSNGCLGQTSQSAVTECDRSDEHRYRWNLESSWKHAGSPEHASLSARLGAAASFWKAAPPTTGSPLTTQNA